MEIIIITNCNNAAFHPPIKKPDNIGGVVQGTITPENGEISPDAIEKYVISTAIIGIIINGNNKNEFITIGIPNKTGSLILKRLGIISNVFAAIIELTTLLTIAEPFIPNHHKKEIIIVINNIPNNESDTLCNGICNN